jgi:hypothetical protein
MLNRLSLNIILGNALSQFIHHKLEISLGGGL